MTVPCCAAFQGVTSELKTGYDWAYREFYRWGSIARASVNHASLKHRAKHFAYSVGWKKFERLWGSIVSLKQLTQMRPLLEMILSTVRTVDEPARPAYRSNVTTASDRAVHPVVGSVKVNRNVDSPDGIAGGTILTR